MKLILFIQDILPQLIVVIMSIFMVCHKLMRLTLSDSVNIGSTPFTAMLWYVETDTTTGNMTLLDLVGGSNADVT